MTDEHSNVKIAIDAVSTMYGKTMMSENFATGHDNNISF